MEVRDEKHTRRPVVLSEAMAVLARTPLVLDAWLRDLPEGWLSGTEGGDTWSAADVVGHLLHTERTNWAPRLRHILTEGESKPFEPFDRFGHLESAPRHLEARLEAFAVSRQASLRVVAELAEADLDRRGAHPVLGAVTLRQLVAAWVAHDLDHLMQIARVLATQYTDAVGPWREYLRIIRAPPVWESSMHTVIVREGDAPVPSELRDMIQAGSTTVEDVSSMAARIRPGELVLVWSGDELRLGDRRLRWPEDKDEIRLLLQTGG